MLWISIEIPLRPAIGVLLKPTGYIFTVLACLYMPLLKQLQTQFEFFTLLPKPAFCAHRLSTLAQTDDKQPGSGKREHAKALVKMHVKVRVAVNATKHIHKRYTHTSAKASILRAQKQHRPQRPHWPPHLTNKDHMEDCSRVALTLARA
jgi:hypothetical protein